MDHVPCSNVEYLVKTLTHSRVGERVCARYRSSRTLSQTSSTNRLAFIVFLMKRARKFNKKTNMVSRGLEPGTFHVWSEHDSNYTMNPYHCRKRHCTNLCQLLDEMFAENAFTENVFESKMIRKKELKNLHTTSKRCPSLRRFVYLLATYCHRGWFIAIGYQTSSRGRSLAVHSVLDCGSCPLQQCRVLGQNPHSL